MKTIRVEIRRQIMYGIEISLPQLLFLALALLGKDTDCPWMDLNSLVEVFTPHIPLAYIYNSHN